MSGTNQTPYAGIAGAPEGVLLIRTASFMSLLNGNPTGVIGGQSGDASTPPDMVWDWIDKILYICTVDGSASTAIWTAFQFTGSLTVTTLNAQAINVSGNETVAGSLTVGANESIGGTLAVTGATTLSGAVTASSTLGVAGALTASAGGSIGGTWAGTPTFSGVQSYANNLVLNNAIALQSKDSGGTARNLLSLDSSNNVDVWNGAGQRIRWLNQAGSTELIGSDNSGNVTIPGNLTVTGTLMSGAQTLTTITVSTSIILNNNVPIEAKDTGGTTRALMDLDGGNNTNIWNAGAGRIRFLNQTGSAELLGSDNSGAVAIPGTLSVTGALTASGGISTTSIAPSGSIANINGLTGFSMFSSGGHPTVQLAAGQFLAFDGTNMTYQTTGLHYFAQSVTTVGVLTGNILSVTANSAFGGLIQANSTGGAPFGGGMSYQGSGTPPYGPQAPGTLPVSLAATASIIAQGGLLVPSDELLKSERRPITPEEGRDFILRCKPQSYMLDMGAAGKKWEAGLVAQEVMEAGYPALVQYTQRGGIPRREYEWGDIKADTLLMMDRSNPIAFLLAWAQGIEQRLGGWAG